MGFRQFATTQHQHTSDFFPHIPSEKSPARKDKSPGWVELGHRVIQMLEEGMHTGVCQTGSSLIVALELHVIRLNRR